MSSIAVAPAFNRDSWASMYAQKHLSVDPGLVAIHYLPADAPQNEIRFVEVNKLLVERDDSSLEPVNFGVDQVGTQPHQLLILDVSPRQWSRIQAKLLPLPCNWSLDGLQTFS